MRPAQPSRSRKCWLPWHIFPGAKWRREWELQLLQSWARCDSRTRLEKDREGDGDVTAWQAERMRAMHANNPRYVLRNYIAQNAIEAAENGDFSEARTHTLVPPLSLGPAAGDRPGREGHPQQPPLLLSRCSGC